MIQITSSMMTDWHPGEIDPVRIGVYQVEKSYGVAWAHWDGSTWSNGDTQPVRTESDVARLRLLRLAHNSSAFPIKRWRGLNYDPT